jgi:putative ABC transport system substrate-binding protein
MTRREAVCLLATVSLAPPLRAQSRPLVGFMNSGSPGPFAHLPAAFRKGLSEAGFEAGRNVEIEYRWADGRYERLQDFAREFVERGVSVIAATGGGMSTRAAKSQGSTIPIVFAMGEDPVKGGYVASLSRPGGHVTGITQLTAELGSKRFGILRELVPGMRRLAVLVNPDFPGSPMQLAELEGVATPAGIQVLPLQARREDEFEDVFAAIAKQGADALLVAADPFFNTKRSVLVGLAERDRLPAIWEFREFVDAGGLVSYGTDLSDAYRHVGTYVGRILKGESPAALPVLRADKFELVINTRAAIALGMTVPDTLLARADGVVE